MLRHHHLIKGVMDTYLEPFPVNFGKKILDGVVKGKKVLCVVQRITAPFFYSVIVCPAIPEPDQLEGDTIPDTPGLAVWKPGHIGVYIGNGEVIEAMGTKYGVVKTQLQGRGWTHWLEIPYIAYE